MSLSMKTPLFAAISAAFLLAAASPSHAQVSPASPIARGHGTYLGQNQALKELTFSVNQLPFGQVGGHAIIREPSTSSFFHMNVTSMMFLGDALAVAGPITMQVGSPFPVGATAFFVVNDNGDGTVVPDDFALGVAPLSFGHLTIQQIIGLVGPPPPQAFAPILTGGIRIF